MDENATFFRPHFFWMWTRCGRRPHPDTLFRHFGQFVYYFLVKKSSREIHPESPQTLDFTGFFD